MADTFVQNESLETVIQRYKGTVYSVALSYVKNREDADDIFQEVFLRYVRSAPRFSGEEHRKAWLLRVTINRAKSHLQKNRFRPAPAQETSVPFTAPETLELHEALQKLPSKYRAVIHLFYFEDYTVDKISAILLSPDLLR